MYEWDRKFEHNISEKCITDRPSQQKAEIVAATEALHQLYKIYYSKERKIDTTVLIKTHTSYLVDAMTRHILVWKKNDWKKLEGDPVRNQVHFRFLEDALSLVEGMGVEVLFWRSKPKHNKLTRALAVRALDGQLENGSRFLDKQAKAWRKAQRKIFTKLPDGEGGLVHQRDEEMSQMHKKLNRLKLDPKDDDDDEERSQLEKSLNRLILELKNADEERARLELEKSLNRLKLDSKDGDDESEAEYLVTSF